jgi:hypothetical protein
MDTKGNQIEIDVCTECEPDSKLESDSSLLKRAECPIHGMCWHLPMIVEDGNGRRKLRYPMSERASKTKSA